MKKILALILSLVMVFGLAACGASTETPATTPTESGTTAGSGVYSQVAICTSFGISINTGPGLPEAAKRKASRIVSARVSTEETK